MKETMFNMNYKTNFPINRVNINKIYSNKYKLNSTFGDSNHQGVITRYKWNKNNKFKDGICHCKTHKCNCKEITFMTFGPPKKELNNSSIIITGGKTMEQQIEVYNFINKVLRDNYKEIYKLNISNFVTYIHVKRKIQLVIKKS